jgi:Ca-activated chloride channel family protein
MIRFAHPDYLLALYFLPLLVIFFWFTYKQQKKAINAFASRKMQAILLPFQSRAKLFLKFIIYFLAIILLVIAMANPQVGSKIEEVKQVGIDVYIILDVSLSMKAEDIKPSRLDKAKFEISKLIQKLRGDRIGLVVFSGEAYVQFPLTTDYSAANLFLNAVDVNSVPQPGTAIGPAMQLAVNSFKNDAATKKAIVVITDGEDHEGDLQTVLTEAADKGILIYAIGLGSPSGVPIPIYNAAGVRTDYKKDREGNVVLTKLDEDILQKIVEAGNGKYYRGSNTEDELDLIYSDLSQLEETEFGATRITDYEDRFYYFLISALLLLMIDFFISTNKSKLLMRFERAIK